MNYISVCSGIEAATVAWHQMGWNPIAFSEIEPFPSAVLKHHYPDVPNVGDMTKYKEWNFGSKTVDLLVGGTPCQSFSVAGLRKGLEDPRGNLALVYCGILDWFRPQWFVWENVPGVLSSSGGRDFGSFLGALVELGYGFAYRVLDAQYFGVAQRRRRVFVVGYLGDWRPAAEVLFERESLRRDTAPSREARQGVASSLTASAGHHGYSSPRGDGSDNLVATFDRQISGEYGTAPVASTISARDYKSPSDLVMPIPLDLRNAGRDPEKRDEQNRQGVGVGEPGDAAHTLTTAFVHGVAQPIAITESGSIASTLRTGGNDHADIYNSVAVVQPIVLMDQGGSVMNVITDGTVGTLRRETHGHEPSVIHNMAVSGPSVGVAQPIPSADITGSLTVGHHGCAGHQHRQGDTSFLVTQPLDTDGGTQAVVAPTLTASNDPSRSPQSSEVTNQVAAVLQASMAVRRLTPVECERLQGFPDNYTNIPWRKSDESPDGPRYKALGNSMAVPVMGWIGNRIHQWNEKKRKNT